MGKAKDRRIAWLKEKAKGPRYYDNKYGGRYYKKCLNCGQNAEWCNGCEMWSCHGCDPYGTCMCN